MPNEFCNINTNAQESSIRNLQWIISTNSIEVIPVHPFAVSVSSLVDNAVWRYVDGNLAVDSKPIPITDTEKTFIELAWKWRKETRGLSTMLHKAMNDNYLDIIALGPTVIPYILKDLKQKPDHWFIALEHLARTNPVSTEDRGDVRKMTKAWLDWGQREGKL